HARRVHFAANRSVSEKEARLRPVDRLDQGLRDRVPDRPGLFFAYLPPQRLGARAQRRLLFTRVAPHRRAHAPSLPPLLPARRRTGIPQEARAPLPEAAPRGAPRRR